MEVRAQTKYIRISAQKARQVMELVRGKPVKEVMAMLTVLPHKSAHLLKKLVKSAIANAENNYDLKADDLYIHRIYADEGPTLPRFLPRARGRADRIKKRSSHLTVIVKEREE
ncbi:MAG: 50S ribosomal protein L22 [bacterium]